MTTEGPLTGHRLVVTRAVDQAAPLADALIDQGAEVVLLPMVAIVDPTDGGAALAAAAARLGDYDRIVVTSPNGARRLLDIAGNLPVADWPPVAAIGPATAGPLQAAGAPVDLVPGEAVAESLLNALPDPPDDGGRLLLVRAESAREVLPAGLVAAGWDLEVVAAYRNVEPAVEGPVLAEAQTAEAVTFTAASAVRRYHDLAGGPRPVDALCIGPVSGGLARNLGFRVAEANPHSVSGLVEAACRWARSRGGFRRLS